MASDDRYTFPFMRLPAEIRNIIYRLVCSNERGFISVYRANWRLPQSKRVWILDAKDDALRRGLLHSCRQIHAEAGRTYWSLNEFMCDDTGVLHSFLKEIGQKQRRQIRSLSVINLHVSGRQSGATEAFKYMHAMTNLRTLIFYFCVSDDYPNGVLEHLSVAAKAALFRLRGLENVRVEPRAFDRNALHSRYVVDFVATGFELSKAEVELCATLTQPRRTRQRLAKR